MCDLSSLYVSYFLKEKLLMCCVHLLSFKKKKKISKSLTWILQMCVWLEVTEQKYVFIDFKNIFNILLN